jgi:hypothetical protein
LKGENGDFCTPLPIHLLIRASRRSIINWGSGVLYLDLSIKRVIIYNDLKEAIWD